MRRRQRRLRTRGLARASRLRWPVLRGWPPSRVSRRSGLGAPLAWRRRRRRRARSRRRQGAALRIRRASRPPGACTARPRPGTALPRVLRACRGQRTRRFPRRKASRCLLGRRAHRDRRPCRRRGRSKGLFVVPRPSQTPPCSSVDLRESCVPLRSGARPYHNWLILWRCRCSQPGYRWPGEGRVPSPAKSRGLCDNGASSDAMDRGRSGLRHGSSIGRGAAALALALVWPLGALCCPIALAGAFTDGGAAFFAGAFAVGVAAACALVAVVRGGGETGRAGLPTPRPFAPVLARLAPLLLVAGVAAVAFLCATGVSVSSPLAFACGGAAGVGEGAALLATGLSFVGLDLPRLVRAVGSSVAGAAGLLAPLLLLGQNPLSTWWYLACVSLAAGVLAAVTAPTAAPAAAAVSPCEPSGPSAPLAELAPATLPCAPVSSLTHPFACLRAGLWEPALGLGLSLMSTLLPWGAFFSGGPASTPAPWTFCAGLLLAGALCLVTARSPLARGPLEPVMHVAMPVLAAAVVGLRMLGDVTVRRVCSGQRYRLGGHGRLLLCVCVARHGCGAPSAALRPPGPL